VIKEGYLQKLPPLGNMRKGWKMRWFKLVVVISSSESSGPVVRVSLALLVCFVSGVHACSFRPFFENSVKMQ
jgi:hypothetical protein